MHQVFAFRELSGRPLRACAQILRTDDTSHLFLTHQRHNLIKIWREFLQNENEIVEVAVARPLTGRPDLFGADLANIHDRQCDGYAPDILIASLYWRQYHPLQMIDLDLDRTRLNPECLDTKAAQS